MACKERQHQVQLIVLCQADNDIRLGDALLCEKVDICTVTADCKTSGQLLREQFAALTISVDHLHLHVLSFQQKCERAPCPPSPDDGGAF